MSTDSDCLKGHRIREIGTAEVHSTYVRTIERNSRIKYHGNGTNSPVFVVTTAGDVMKQYRLEEGVLRVPEKEPGFGMSLGRVNGGRYGEEHPVF